jgi:hypothetical protein
VHQSDNPHKPPTTVKGTKEEMWTSLENKKKVATNFSRSVFKRKNIVEEGGASSLRVKKGTREHKFEGTKNDER